MHVQAHAHTHTHTHSGDGSEMVKMGGGDDGAMPPTLVMGALQY